MNRLLPYTALLSARYRMMLQYRVAALAGAGTQFWWGFIRIMILEAFFLSSSDTQPMTLAAVVSYIWLGQAFLGLLPWTYDAEIRDMIDRGDVAYELVRPVDLYSLWFARTLATRAASVSLRCLPIFLCSGWLLSLTPLSHWALAPPDSPAAAAVFALAIAGAFLLSAAITTLGHISMLWTISGEGLARILPAAVTLFSGLIVPLPLFPDWMQPLISLLPFHGLGDTPFRIYTGDLGASAGLIPIAISFAWTLVLVVLGRGLLVLGHRRMVVQGG